MQSNESIHRECFMHAARAKLYVLEVMLFVCMKNTAYRGVSKQIQYLASLHAVFVSCMPYCAVFLIQICHSAFSNSYVYGTVLYSYVN